MKRFIITMALFLAGFSLPAQKITVKKYIAHQKKLLELAKKYNDKEIFRNALAELIALEGDQSKYKDSLAQFYLRNGEYVSFLLLSDELLKQNPGNDSLILEQAVVYEKLGNMKKAVELYEKSFAKQPQNVLLGYQLAWNQYKLKRIEEAYSTLQKIKDLHFPQVTVQVPAPGSKYQMVPIKAAYFNLLGLVTYDLHNLPVAKQNFEEALKIFPAYQSAKQNKEAVKIMLEKLKKPVEKNQ